MESKPLISIVIVNYRVPECIREAIRSLRLAKGFDQCQIVIVDNNSNDNSQFLIKNEFPEVEWIQLKTNIGFGKACNVGVQQSKGEYLLILNPDTVVSTDTLEKAVAFMETRPDVGMMGPKILNPDGTLQPSCHRSFPTPSVVFYHYSGLSKLFPTSKRFGRYNLTFLDPDKASDVDAISGSFMFLKRSLFMEIGGFDERFFMYGEDLDICWRIREKGLKVWYEPSIQIIHLKGKSSAKSQLRSRFAFYEAMILFSRKYHMINRTFLPGWLINFGIFTLAAINIVSNLVRAFTASLIDLGIINLVLWLGLVIRFSVGGASNPYHAENFSTMVLLHLLLSGCFLFMFSYNGIYSEKRYSVVKALFSGLFASILFMTCVYFLKNVAFSRVAFAVSSIVSSFMLVGWREIIPKVAKQIKKSIFAPDHILIVGAGPITSALVKNIEREKSSRINGIIWTDEDNSPGQFEGYPVLGNLKEIKEIINTNKVDVLLISTPLPWYSLVIETLGSTKIKNLTIRWVQSEVFDLPQEQLPEIIPLKTFSV